MAAVFWPPPAPRLGRPVEQVPGVTETDPTPVGAPCPRTTLERTRSNWHSTRPQSSTRLRHSPCTARSPRPKRSPSAVHVAQLAQRGERRAHRRLDAGESAEPRRRCERKPGYGRHRVSRLDDPERRGARAHARLDDARLPGPRARLGRQPDPVDRDDGERFVRLRDALGRNRVRRHGAARDSLAGTAAGRDRPDSPRPRVRLRP